jgi:hypothetical protein
MTLRPSQIIHHIDTDTDSILSDDQSYVAYSDDEIDIIKNKHEHIIPIKHRTNLIKKKVFQFINTPRIIKSSRKIYPTYSLNYSCINKYCFPFNFINKKN